MSERSGSSDSPEVPLLLSPWDYLYPGHEPTPAAMALEAIPQALWFFLPAFVANPMAVVFGGGTPIAFGPTPPDRERLFGDRKTRRGLLGLALVRGVTGLVLCSAAHPLCPSTDPGRRT